MDQRILTDLADQTARNFGRTDANFAGKMARRLLRKFALRLSREEILEQAAHYAAIYQLASLMLAECLQPSTDGFAHPENVDDESYMALLVQNFPDDEREILNIIGGWVIYYEYLH